MHDMSDKILIFIFVKIILFYTGKSPLEAPLIQWNTEIDSICSLSVYLIMVSRGQKYRPLSVAARLNNEAEHVQKEQGCLCIHIFVFLRITATAKVILWRLTYNARFRLFLKFNSYCTFVKYFGSDTHQGASNEYYCSREETTWRQLAISLLWLDSDSRNWPFSHLHSTNRLHNFDQNSGSV